MISMEVRLKNHNKIVKKYDKANARISKGISQKLKLVGIKMQRESRKNAKISPTSNKDRGGLEKSILWHVSGNKCYIFVPDNSLAGKYAWLQHDFIEGRGTGTIRKPGDAGWKFIDRAVEENTEWIKKTIGSSFKILERDVK